MQQRSSNLILILINRAFLDIDRADLMNRYFRPVGYPVSLIGSQKPPLEDHFSPYSVLFYQSGTESLASAIAIAKEKANKDQPEILVSAYACPDVISAILFNDVTPVLIDYEVDRPWLKLSEVESAINNQTIGIIAINFLGIKERTHELKDITRQHDLTLIEDLAQWFPEPDTSSVQGDVAIVSFGRGKPVSVLGGGALLVKNSNDVAHAIQVSSPTKASLTDNIKYAIKTSIYNTLISPLWYWLPNKLPFLKLGETHFDPLTEVNGISGAASRLLNRNKALYFSRKKEQESLSKILMNTLQGFVNLPVETDTLNASRLLRYPILLKSLEDKQRLLEQLKHLGVSPLYPKPLFEFSELEGRLKLISQYPNSKDFCNRLLTFPVYEGFPNKSLAQALAQRD